MNTDRSLACSTFARTALPMLTPGRGLEHIIHGVQSGRMAERVEAAPSGSFPRILEPSGSLCIFKRRAGIRSVADFISWPQSNSEKPFQPTGFRTLDATLLPDFGLARDADTCNLTYI